MNEPTLTVVGNVTRDPELRYAPSGVAVCTFNLANTPRNKNQAGEYEDGTTLWLRVTCFRTMAENVTESIYKGARVMVQGRLKREVWEDKEGNERESLVLVADEIAPSLRWATADVKKATRGSEAPKRRREEPVEDPWALPEPTEEPPF
jgi:single-strand DNA-binding protein